MPTRPVAGEALILHLIQEHMGSNDNESAQKVLGETDATRIHYEGLTNRFQIPVFSSQYCHDLHFPTDMATRTCIPGQNSMTVLLVDAIPL